MTVLVLPAELTQKQASACLCGLEQSLKSEAAQVSAGSERATSVLVDATALVRFDSSALAVLLALRRETLGWGKDFAIRGLPPRLENLASLYGIVELLPSESIAPV